MEVDALSVENLTVAYGGIRAVRAASLKLLEGDMVGLIGANGAGKTTTLRAISGMVRPRTGRVMYRGRRVLGLPPYRLARLGLVHVPEGRGILGPLSVQENLLLSSSAARAQRKSGRFRLKQVYQLFPILEERRYQSAGLLSGGQQQMLAIGRALLADPHVLLLDEPSLGLAPLVTDQVFDTLLYLNREEGLTMLIVEQNADRALAATTACYIMEGGEIVKFLRHERSKERALSHDIAQHYLGQA